MAEKKTITVLFICTGNTCRSSMAEALAKVYLRQREKELESSINIRVLSAGTGAVDDEPASPQAREALRELGVDISEHRSRVVTEELLQEADIILTMTERHKKQLEKMLPEARKKIHLLKEYAWGEDAWLKLKEQAELLYHEIENGKRTFFQEHSREIEALGKRREQLLVQIQEIEEELNTWEQKLWETEGKKMKELRKIEEELKNQDVLDPFGQPLETYRSCAKELSQYIARALKRISE